MKNIFCRNQLVKTNKIPCFIEIYINFWNSRYVSCELIPCFWSDIIISRSFNKLHWEHTCGYMQKICNSIVITLELCLCCVNTLRPRQNGRHFPEDIFKCIFLNENAWISIKISLKFVPKGPINKIPALVQIMAWRRSGDKPLSEPIMVSLLTHICVTQLQWAKYHDFYLSFWFAAGELHQNTCTVIDTCYNNGV